eukprot:m.156872 g.156872  ORF g.156872 m.156872 type:complete len:128 (+) comp16446_c0_seq3:2653-3036(+)
MTSVQTILTETFQTTWLDYGHVGDGFSKLFVRPSKFAVACCFSASLSGPPNLVHVLVSSPSFDAQDAAKALDDAALVASLDLGQVAASDGTKQVAIDAVTAHFNNLRNIVNITLQVCPSPSVSAEKA